MKNNRMVPVWNVFSAKDFAPVAARLAEYGIPCELGIAGSMIPGHAPVLVPAQHNARASEVVCRDFGRRGGNDIDIGWEPDGMYA